MVSVGWIPDREYTDDELNSLSFAAMKKMAELGKDGTIELEKYGEK